MSTNPRPESEPKQVASNARDRFENLFEFMAFRLGQERFGIDIQLVREIRSRTAVTPIPHAQDYVLGVMNLRGAVIPVINVRQRLGLTDSSTLDRDVIVVVKCNTRMFGLLVDEVSDILGVANDHRQSTPAITTAEDGGFVDSIATIDDKIIQFIDTERLLGDIHLKAS